MFRMSRLVGLFAALMASAFAIAIDACGTSSDSASSANADASSDDGSSSLDGAPGDATTTDGAATPGPHGLYIPTFHTPITTDPNLTAALDLPYVDGFYVSRAWRSVEPTEGNYVWASVLDADLRAIAAHGKHATLGIGAGANAPPYICAPVADGGVGAQCLTLVTQSPALAGNLPPCENETLPLPWDPTLQDRFGKMVTSLAAYLASDPVLSSVVVDVKITGFNDNDEETDLPLGKMAMVAACEAGPACNAGECDRSDALGMLVAAGFDDATAVNAFLNLSAIFRGAFPGQPIGSQVSNALPSPEGGMGSLAYLMVTSFANDSTARPITVQDNGLTASGGIDPQTLYAREAGAQVGFQSLFSIARGGAVCVMGRGFAPDGGTAPCDENVFRGAVDNAVGQGGASWLEIYSEDVIAFPDAAAYAHSQLLK
jgi:hypothetical protein